MSEKDLAIQVENMSKLYRLGVKEASHENFGSALIDFVRSPLKNYRKYRSLYHFADVDISEKIDSEDILWALKDVSFEVERGEVLGIIGINGAGKSTLLKILSRITPPTTGRIEIRGRVSSLLEVGTGFHPELTGRENVYLNGTILGMRKKEIERKFDEIVEFSGVEKFLDTPVKRYSSGMRVRLAFAVAAHLEPEILIVDEVLAVGDAAFQQKCMNKMQDVGEEGRTVLFVSHSMPAVTRMCSRVILLNAGRLLDDGSPDKVVGDYLRGVHGSSAVRTWDGADCPAGEVARLHRVCVRNEDGEPINAVDIRKPLGIDVEFEVLQGGHVLMPNFGLFNDQGTKVFGTVDLDPEWRKKPRPPGRYVSTVWVPGNLLSEGLFVVNLAIWALEPSRIMQFLVRDVVAFQVIDSMDGDSARGDWSGDLSGLVRPKLEWETRYEPNEAFEEAHALGSSGDGGRSPLRGSGNGTMAASPGERVTQGRVLTARKVDHDDPTSG